ncbi:MAG: virulence protein RhuM/Fic/DOC family protein [Pseudomonadota bacterium]
MSTRKSDQLVFVSDETGRNINVHVENDTVWLTQAQMGEIFSVGASTISQHLANIYEAEELSPEDTMRRIQISRAEGERTVKRALNHYNLDAILSVGYRVSSKRGTRFRRWATRVLRDRIEEDVKRRKLLETSGLIEIQNMLALAKGAVVTHDVVPERAQAVFDVIERYARSFTLLLQYDEDRLPDQPQHASTDMVELPLSDAETAIAQLKATLMEKGEATELFGQPRGDGLAGVLGNIEQTFGGEPLYPNVEIRAANLIYFIIKDHPFTDGNKRIGSFLFLHYLERNKRLYDDGAPRIDDNTLVAIALLIAESEPSQRDLIIRLVMGLFDGQAQDDDTESIETAGSA